MTNQPSWSKPSFAGRIERDAGPADRVFKLLDGVLNTVVPNHPSHTRYVGIGAIPLAVVVARDSQDTDKSTGASVYNPFGLQATLRSSFMADNRKRHPDLWQPVPIDEELLGREAPNSLGRTYAYAFGKIAKLATTPNDVSSFGDAHPHIADGVVGLAGGIRFDGSLLAISGMWEIHDHMAGRLFEGEVRREQTAGQHHRTADELAEVTLEAMDQISRIHSHKVAAEAMTRPQVGELLGAVDEIIHDVAA